MKNKLFLKSALLIALATTIISCSSKPKIPVWEIKKEGSPSSYLVASSNFLSKTDIDKMLTNDIINYFDVCENLISFWDLTNSDLLEAKQWIEIGNNLSIKDTLSQLNFKLLKAKIEQYNTESSLKTQLPDSVKIKTHFYLNDIINQNTKAFFNLDQFFYTRALPQQKETHGLETFQSYYKSFSTINQEEYIQEINKIESIHKAKNEFETVSAELYKKGEYEELFKQNNIQTKLGLSPNKLLNKNSDEWANKIDLILAKQKTFILLDINYVNPSNKMSLYNKLLSKGYQLTIIN